MIPHIKEIIETKLEITAILRKLTKPIQAIAIADSTAELDNAKL